MGARPPEGLRYTDNPSRKIASKIRNLGGLMLSGTNKLCAQCSGKCKQWSEVTVVKCPNYKSRTLRAQQNVKEELG